MIFDSSNVAISPTTNLDEFRYTISTLVADDLVTTWARAPLVDPRIFSPNIEDVSRVKPDGNVNESKVGADVSKDSWTEMTSATSGKFNDITSSWTLVPKYVLVVSPLDAVEAADTVLLIVNFSLLIYSFFLLLIPIFFAVTLTTTFVAPTFSPVNSTVAPPEPRVTWSDVKSSTVPSL